MSKNKTRTKDKYRVVYNDTQRIELENEFRLNEYIAIPRKQEIAQKLQLSERQIKIWFQNRRAKKRKQQKRTTKSQQERQTSTATTIATTTTTTTTNINTTLNPQMRPQLHQQQPTYQQPQYRQSQPLEYPNQHQDIHPHVTSPLQPNPPPQQIHQQRIQSPVLGRQIPQAVGVQHQPQQMVNQPLMQHPIAPGPATMQSQQQQQHQQPQQQHQFAPTFVNHHNQDLHHTQQQSQQQIADQLNNYQPAEVQATTTSVASVGDQLSAQHHHLHQHHHHSQHHQYYQHQSQQYHNHHHHHQYNGLSTAMQQHNHQLMIEQHYANAMAAGSDQQSRLTGSPSEQNLIGSIENPYYYNATRDTAMVYTRAAT